MVEEYECPVKVCPGILIYPNISKPILSFYAYLLLLNQTFKLNYLLQFKECGEAGVIGAIAIGHVDLDARLESGNAIDRSLVLVVNTAVGKTQMLSAVMCTSAKVVLYGVWLLKLYEALNWM